MSRPLCPPEENILRAIHASHWDAQNSRGYSPIFKGRNTSVSRLSILGLAALLDIFHQQLDSSPSGKIIGAGEINIGELQRIGREHLHPLELNVEEAPEPNNPAHAEIPQEISRGLAKKIIDALAFHWVASNI